MQIGQVLTLQGQELFLCLSAYQGRQLWQATDSQAERPSNDYTLLIILVNFKPGAKILDKNKTSCIELLFN